MSEKRCLFAELIIALVPALVGAITGAYVGVFFAFKNDNFIAGRERNLAALAAQAVRDTNTTTRLELLYLETQYNLDAALRARKVFENPENSKVYLLRLETSALQLALNDPNLLSVLNRDTVSLCFRYAESANLLNRALDAHLRVSLQASSKSPAAKNLCPLIFEDACAFLGYLLELQGQTRQYFDHAKYDYKAMAESDKRIEEYKAKAQEGKVVSSKRGIPPPNRDSIRAKSHESTRMKDPKEEASKTAEER